MQARGIYRRAGFVGPVREGVQSYETPVKKRVYKYLQPPCTPPVGNLSSTPTPSLFFYFFSEHADGERRGLASVRRHRKTRPTETFPTRAVFGLQIPHTYKYRTPINTARLSIPRAYKYRTPTNTARL